jgi:hypothetical protein
MEAVTAVAAERFTIILNVKFMLELLVMVFTLTMAVLLLTNQLHLREAVHQQMLATIPAHVFTLENAFLKEAALFV